MASSRPKRKGTTALKHGKPNKKQKFPEEHVEDLAYRSSDECEEEDDYDMDVETAENSKFASKSPKKTAFVFGQEEAEQIDGLILKFGLNYKAIHDAAFREKSS